jgi:hypothetical protein
MHPKLIIALADEQRRQRRRESERRKPHSQLITDRRGSGAAIEP